MTTSTPNDNAFPASERYGLNSMDHSAPSAGAEIEDVRTPNFTEARRIFRALQLAANPGEDYREVAARIDREACRYRDFLERPKAIGKVILNVKQMGAKRADGGTVREQYHVVDPAEGQLDPTEGRASVCYTFNRSSSKVLEFVVCDEEGNPLFPIARAYASWLGERAFDLGRDRKFYLNMFEDRAGSVRVHSGFVPYVPEHASLQRRDSSPSRALDRAPWRRRILSGLTPFTGRRTVPVFVLLYCAIVAAPLIMFSSAMRNLPMKTRLVGILVTSYAKQSAVTNTAHGPKSLPQFPAVFTPAAMTIAGHSTAGNFSHNDLQVRHEVEAVAARHLVYVQSVNLPDDVVDCVTPSISCHDLMAMLTPGVQAPAVQADLEHAAATICTVMDPFKIVVPCKSVDGEHGLIVYSLNPDALQLITRTDEIDCTAKNQDVWLTRICGASSATASPVATAELNATIASTGPGAGSTNRSTGR